MFYSTDILTRRRDGLGMFWLAATLGSKGGGGSKKLTRKEIMKCDLVAACKQLIEPEEPMALRLSSTLLFGIARIYEQQFAFFYADVSLMHSNLKKNFNDLFNKISQTNALDLTPAQTGNAAVANLTLQADPALQVFGFDLEWDVGMDWAALGLGGRQQDDGEGELDFGSMEEPSPRGRIIRHPTGAHQVRDIAAITLQEHHHVDDYLRDEEDQYIIGGIGEDEVGLLEGHSAELDADLRAASSSRTGSGSRRAGVPMSSSAGGGRDVQYEQQDLGGMDDVWMGHDFGGGDEPLLEGETMEERAQREHKEGFAQRSGDDLDQVDQGEEEVPMDLDLDLKDDHQGKLMGRKRKKDAVAAADDQPLAVVPAKGLKTKKGIKKTVIWDEVIELTDEQLTRSRSNYDERMEMERKKASKIKEAKRGQQAIQHMFDPPHALAHPELARTMWPKPRGLGEGRVEEERKEQKKKKKKKASPNSAKNGNGSSNVEEDPRKSDADQGDLEKGVSGDFGNALFDVFHDMGGGDEQIGQFDQFDLGGMDNHDFALDGENVEEGLPGATGSQQKRDSLMPWNNFPQSSDAGAGRDFGGLGSSQAGGSRRAGSATPRASMIKQASREGSLAPSQLRSGTPMKGRTTGLDALDGDDAQQENGPTAPVDDPVLATLENETFNFYQYAKQAAEDEEDLHFSDLVPVASSNAIVASQAFYHLLSIASKGLATVKQHEPYDEIQIKVLKKARICVLFSRTRQKSNQCRPPSTRGPSLNAPLKCRFMHPP